jgi:hypothetical protein
VSTKTKTALAVAVAAVIAFLGAYLIDLNGDLAGSDPTTTVTAAPTTVDPTTTTVPPTTTTVPPTTGTPQPAQHVPGGADGKGGTWPGPDNTGPAVAPTRVMPKDPNGARVVINDGRIIDGWVINDDIVVLAGGGTIRNSIVNGHIDADCDGCTLTVEDSIVNGGTWQGPSIGYGRFTVLRSEILGAAASLLCSGGCHVEDSYMHGQVTVPGVDNHSSAFGSNGSEYGDGITVRHNTLWCEAAQDPNPPFGGCTSDIAFVPDFAPNSNVLVERNLLIGDPEVGYCGHFGHDVGKPYPNMENMRVIDNVAQRGETGKCGIWGADTSYKPDGPGNEWRGNTWDDGTVWNHT